MKNKFCFFVIFFSLSLKLFGFQGDLSKNSNQSIFVPDGYLINTDSAVFYLILELQEDASGNRIWNLAKTVNGDDFDFQDMQWDPLNEILSFKRDGKVIKPFDKDGDSYQPGGYVYLALDPNTLLAKGDIYHIAKAFSQEGYIDAMRRVNERLAVDKASLNRDVYLLENENRKLSETGFSTRAIWLMSLLSLAAMALLLWSFILRRNRVEQLKMENEDTRNKLDASEVAGANLRRSLQIHDENDVAKMVKDQDYKHFRSYIRELLLANEVKPDELRFVPDEFLPTNNPDVSFDQAVGMAGNNFLPRNWSVRKASSIRRFLVAGSGECYMAMADGSREMATELKKGEYIFSADFHAVNRENGERSTLAGVVCREECFNPLASLSRDPAEFVLGDGVFLIPVDENGDQLNEPAVTVLPTSPEIGLLVEEGTEERALGFSEYTEIDNATEDQAPVKLDAHDLAREIKGILVEKGIDACINSENISAGFHPHYKVTFFQTLSPSEFQEVFKGLFAKNIDTNLNLESMRMSGTENQTDLFLMINGEDLSSLRTRKGVQA
jgi:hypothetical protein